MDTNPELLPVKSSDGKPQLVFTVGLPGSGKSTWAKALVASSPEAWVRVNKDDLRSMLHGGAYSKQNESQVVLARNKIIADALLCGKSVVVDDTNFALFHEQVFHELASKHGAALVKVDFTFVPLAECIRRDLARADSVGEQVIHRMYNQYTQQVAPRDV